LGLPPPRLKLPFSRGRGSAREPLLPAHPATRLYVSEPLAAGAAVALAAPQAHRLRNVLRLGAGAAVAAFNERDGEWLCRLDALGRGAGSLVPVAQRRLPQPEPDLWLLFAPIRRTRLDWLVEKATELGAAALVPVVTGRTQPERVGQERLRAQCVAAAEQCGRLSVPEIRAAQPLARVLAAWPDERRLVVCDETGGGAPIADALAGIAPAAPAAVLVGPEGGFTETELDALGKPSIVTRVGLGPRVLRAETAALAALAAFQAIAGDWRRGRAD
jgi:16S rRNA (uracil1498-N3)-methyltransferase